MLKKNIPKINQDIDLMICWFSNEPMRLNGKYALKHTSNDVRCMIKEVFYKVNINTLERDNDKSFKMNDIRRIKIRTTKSLFYDSYLSKNRITESVVLIDEATNNTACAGMII